MVDYIKKIEDKKKDVSALHTRMDTDKKLQYLEKYVMRDKQNRAVPNIINVTLPDTAIFAANVIAAINSANEQIEVTTEDNKLDTAGVEDLFDAAFLSADNALRLKGKPPLNSYLDNHNSIRGRSSSRCIFQMKDGKLSADITPWDPRYVYYDLGEDGLEWGAYETTRTRDDIEAEYGHKITEKKGKVLDVWHKDGNEVWVDDVRILEQEHPFGFTPVVVETVPIGSLLADDDSMEHDGESIFFLIRDIVPEINRLASIAQTVNMRAANSALLWVSEKGEQATPPEWEDLMGFQAVTPAEKQGGAQPITIQDVQRSFDRLNAILEGRLQRGSLSSIDLGTLQFELSAVALVEIGEGREQVFLPRLKAKGFHKKQLANIISRQLQIIGGTVDFGIAGRKKTYSTSILDNEFDIDFNYYVKSPKLDMARHSIYAAAGDGVSQQTKRRDILQLEDPEGEKRQLDIEEAERLSPSIKMVRVIKALADEGRDFEAELMAHDFNLNLDAMESGNIEGIKSEPRDEPTQPQGQIPLFGTGKGGQRSSPQKTTELQQTPTEEV